MSGPSTDISISWHAWFRVRWQRLSLKIRLRVEKDLSIVAVATGNNSSCLSASENVGYIQCTVMMLLLISLFSDDRSPSNLQINSHSLWSSCKDVPKTCAMLRFFVETVQIATTDIITEAHFQVTTFLMNWFAAYFQFPLSPSVICTPASLNFDRVAQHLFQQLLNWSLDALDALTSAIIPTDVVIFAFFVWKALLRLANGWTMCWSMQIKCKVCTFCYSTNRPQDSNKHHTSQERSTAST